MEFSETNPLSSSSSYSSSFYNNNNNNNNQVSSQTQIAQSILNDSTNNIISNHSTALRGILELPGSFSDHSQELVQQISQLGYVALRIRAKDVTQDLYVKEKVLQASSPCFKDLLEYSMQIGDSKEIELLGENLEALIQTLDFMVSGNFPKTVDDIIGAFRIADHYEIEKLREKCEDWLIKNITTENYQKLWDGTKHINLPNLKHELLHFVIWRFLCIDPPANNELKQLLEQQGHHLQQLDTKVAISEHVSKFLPLLPLFPNITSLTLFYHGNKELWETLESDYPKIVQGCPYLSTLKTDLHYFREVANFDATLTNLMQHCPLSLRHLDISATVIKDSTLSTILKRFPNLHSLNVNHCHAITLDGLKTVGEQCQELKSLKANNIDFGYLIPNFEELNQVLQQYPHLEELDISMEGLLLIESLKLIQQPLPLRKLRIAGHLNKLGIEEILQKCPNLEELEIKNYDTCIYPPNDCAQRWQGIADFYAGPRLDFQLSHHTYPNLRKFKVEYVEDNEDKITLIEEVRQRCPNLVEF